MEKLTTSQLLEQILYSYTEQQNDLRVSLLLEKFIVSQMAQENYAQTIVVYINKLLQKNVKRWDGLYLLDKIITHHPAPSLSTNTVDFWIKVCVNVGINEQLTPVRFSVLTKIIRLCSSTSEFNKLIINELPKVLNMCITVRPSPTISEASLVCLKVCMQKYPSACGPFKKQVESYVIEHLICEFNSVIIKKAGAAFNALQRIGGSGPEGITYKTNWTNQMYKLCITLHKQYDTFLPCGLESSNVPDDIDPYELRELSKSEWDNSHLEKQVVILKNVVIFIEAMLLGGFPVEKCFRVSSLLSAIKRGLSADMLGDYNKTFNDEKLEAALYVHHVHLLSLLKSFILRASPDLFINESIITKLLVNCLQRGQKQNFENSEYLKAVYDVLTDWISACGNTISKSAHEKLLLSILNDITPKKTNVSLQFDKNTNMADKEVAGSLLKVRETTCVGALKCGAALFTYVVLHTDDKEICETVLKTVIELLINIQGKMIVYPYSNNQQCQLSLFEMLISIFSQPLFSSRCNFISIATSILQKGQEKPYVRAVCGKGLVLLGKISHPLCPTLDINLTVDDEQLLINNRKRKRANDSLKDLQSLSQENQYVQSHNLTNVSKALENQPSQSSGRINIISQVVINDNTIKQTKIDVDNVRMEIQESKEQQMEESILQTSTDSSKTDKDLNVVEMDEGHLGKETALKTGMVPERTYEIMCPEEVNASTCDGINEDELEPIMASFNDIPNEND